MQDGAVWADYTKEARDGQRKRRLLLLGTLLCLMTAITAIYVAYFFHASGLGDKTSPPMLVLSGVISDDDTHLMRDTSSSRNDLPGVSSPITIIPTIPAIPSTTLLPVEVLPHQTRTEPDIADRPAPQFSLITRRVLAGPTGLRFYGMEISVGVANYTSHKEITGAAGEWRVAPWWQPGWIPESSDCGLPGNSVIAGHVSWYTRPGPFQYLGALKPGDVVGCANSAGIWFSYVVTEVLRVPYTDTGTYWGKPMNDQQSLLTLYTCTPEVDGIIIVRAQIENQQ